MVKAGFKKFLVFIPVLILGIVYAYDHTDLYRQLSGRRQALLGLTFLLLYGWIILDIRRRRISSFLYTGILSSFYVYIFMVLTLTGYFILFREISSVNWYDNMVSRIEKKHYVNFELFEIFRIYKFSDTQILGNLLMLLPLGIYLPLLYKSLSTFLKSTLVVLLISCMIECLQLVTSHRSVDIDDVMLNTLGGIMGFIFYAVARYLFATGRSQTTPAIS